MDSDEEENYFISVTDLMTGVVFIFVILLVTYSITFHEAEKKLAREKELHGLSTSEIAKAEQKAKDYQKQLAQEISQNRVKAEKMDSLAKLLRDREERRRAVLLDTVTRLNKRGVKVTLDNDNGIIRLPEELLFDPGQASLRPEAALPLAVLAEELKQLLGRWCDPAEDFRLEALFIEGHTDSIPIHTDMFANNWALSTSRAVNVSGALTESQPDIKAYLNPSGMPVLGVSGYGENRPVADNSTKEERRKNRRIDLRFLLAYPTAEQMQKATAGFAPQ